MLTQDAVVVRLLLLVHRVPDGVADALLHVLIRLEPDLGVPDHGGAQPARHQSLKQVFC